MIDGVQEIEAKAAAGGPLTRAEAERLVIAADLPGLGALGEAARRALHGDRVTFVRVLELSGPDLPLAGVDAGEARITSTPGSIDELFDLLSDARQRAPGLPLTGFSLTDLLNVTNGDLESLVALAPRLWQEGLEAVADVPLEDCEDVARAIAAIRALQQGGVNVFRPSILRAEFADRLRLLERAVEIHRATRAFKAVAPLPRIDPVDRPSAGYDDVRTIVLARLMCREIPSIQVDWQLYGPKLAQVAIVYGADDIDRVAATDAQELGHRRSAKEEMERHIRAAFAEPFERNGRFEARI
jgi:hypothetical protein